MSRTHKDVPVKHRKPRDVYDYSYNTEKVAYLNENDKLRYWYKELPGLKPKKRKEVDLEYHWMTTPSWWTRLTMNRPTRRQHHLLEHKVLFCDLEDFDFVDTKKKPFNYYW
jgi:hypothetical protein